MSNSKYAFCDCSSTCNRLLTKRTIRKHRERVANQRAQATDLDKGENHFHQMDHYHNNFDEDREDEDEESDQEETDADDEHSESDSESSDGSNFDGEDEMDVDKSSSEEGNGFEEEIDFDDESDSLEESSTSETDSLGSDSKYPGLFEKEELKRKLFSNSPLDLKGSLLSLMKWASDHKIGLEALGDLLVVIKKDLLPAENSLPASMHLLYKAIGLDLQLFEQHVCVNDCCLFPKLSKKEFKLHQNDTCPKCNEPRFSSKVTPRKIFYYFPIAWQLENFKKMPEFAQSIEKMWKKIQEIDFGPLKSFWGGSIAEPVLLETKDLDDFFKNLGLSVGWDPVNCFVSSEYGIIPIGVKLLNLDDSDRTSAKFIMLTSIIPGKPKNLEPYFQPLINEIKHSKQVAKNSPGHPVYHLLTTEHDHMAMLQVHEPIGVQTKENCPRSIKRVS